MTPHAALHTACCVKLLAACYEITHMLQNPARDRSRTLIALLVTLTVATVTLVVLFGNIVADMRERMRIANALDKAIIGRCNNITRHRF